MDMEKPKKETEQQTERLEETDQEIKESAKGAFRKFSSFINRHIQAGEDILAKEQLEKDYRLNEIFEPYQEETGKNFKVIKDRTLNRLLQETKEINPDPRRLKPKEDYIRSRADELFAYEMKFFH